MKANPSVMTQNLKLDIHLTAEQRATRTITIKGSSFAKSRMFASLKNMLPDTDTKYMQSDDANKLMNEVVSNIIAEDVVSGSYVAQDDQLVVKDLLAKQLSLPTVQSQHMAKHEWDSIFWDPTFARPDKVTNYLNETMTYDQGKDQFTLKETGSSSGSAKFSVFEKFSLGGSG